ncbi:Thiol-disulfide isomerase or thioredoxin [Peptoniphilus asaccharolyticus DSM 20463]|uniref:Thiol-disulfide isomerase or thioredoxin n=1 Tax=Peptoniphilus asaccharolyticus DSM 20463 TaxID=573058 RepID=A0A1W1V1V0_PEPAS|nr:TlpA disulfide reductase family protein [Peptoniphilus asaccharolyticus]MBL7576049.1 TlpA family protein disulfide reductase [Peptoniphilus asaccharolyticus]SMB87359.1 Thiol-disulfide isomerase or thioredoxin [Peptoniphilus asaccharolyticus DSM 20463]
MKKIVSKGACLLLTLCLSLSAVGCQKSNENNKIKEGQSISSEQAGMSTNANGKTETFKPSDYTLEAKEEYVYEYLGLKFKLSDETRKYISDKKIAMLDDQSPIDKELKYAILTFNKMTEEQKNAVIEKMGDGYEKWQNELERVGTIGIFEKNTSEEEISKITKCDTHTKIGVSSDGNYDCYLSTNSGAESNLLDEFNKTEIEIIDKKERPENGFVLSEKTDLKNTEAFNKETSGNLSNVVTKDINGKEFSSKDFADYDITMVNVFATWCTACVKEIPDLVEVYKEMKDKGVNIVGVVTDTVDDNGENKDALEKAKIIQEKTKAPYSFLMPDKTNFNGRLNGIQALPETFFVNKNGEIVGETYSGAKSAKEWKEVIEKELANIKNK